MYIDKHVNDKIIKYNDEGIYVLVYSNKHEFNTHPDFRLGEIAKGLNYINLYTNQELLILATQVLVKRKILNHEKIIIYYLDEDIFIDIDSEGVINNWSNNFCNFIDICYKELFGF